MTQDMHDVGKALLVLGLAIAGLGLLLWLSPRLPGLGRLPGDILIERDGFRFYFPLTSGLLVSAVLSVLFWLWGRFR